MFAPLEVDAYSGDLAFHLHHAIATGIPAKILGNKNTAGCIKQLGA
jgi:hypothetical protein